MRWGSSFTLILIVAAAAFAAPGGNDDFSIEWHTVDGGGGTSAGGGLTLMGTIGQPDAMAAMTGGEYSLAGGFWPGAAGSAGGSSCPQDYNGDRAVDVFDLLTLLAGFGACAGDPAPCQADLDGDGDVDVMDMLNLLTAWGPCP